MRRKNSSLMGLLNMNGSIYRGVQFHEPYQFTHLLNKSHRSLNEEISVLGELLVEKVKRIRAIHGAWKNFGMSPFLEKLLRKSSGKIG